MSSMRALGANVLAGRSYSDVLLAFGVLIIMSLMVFRLPVAVIDALVGVNIAMGMGLLLIAIYIPTPVAFNSFPSVLLISTLFRLSLSVATTRLILLDGDAGNIIDAFGNFVAGGNLVVGLVVFIIITVVQFIVIAKGAERVAEVAARFTLDAMPGKQMSIDSDLRAGLIDNDEAKNKRKVLEQESQLNGALDGAMKFVKGDSIASIIIVIVNLVAGLAVGMLQRGMDIGEAVQIYSILTIGDGMVAQIPALLGAMSAGLIVTRTTNHDNDKHLGAMIGRQLSGQPRAMLMTGIIALLFALVPGFPSMVFLALACALMAAAHFAAPEVLPRWVKLLRRQPLDEFDVLPGELETMDSAPGFAQPGIAQPLMIEFAPAAEQRVAGLASRRRLLKVRDAISEQLGTPLPEPGFRCCEGLAERNYRILIFDVIVASGDGVGENDVLEQPSGDETGGELVPISYPNESLAEQLDVVLRQNAGQFLGVQEVSNLLDVANQEYPALVKEVLRAVTPQCVAEVLRNLVNEGIPIRNLRAILEALAEWGAREKDPGGLTEFVRIGL
ncbi:MAG: FHIPEP family type III secretion protein, partial [Pseudomonadales bacterium]